jgi:Tfp pilus assembly protein PilX
MMNKYSVLKYQSGVVLIISLVMLLALTLIGVTSSSVTGLQEKMAANSKDRNLAFQAAESALRWVETNIFAQSTQPPNFDCSSNPQLGTNGLYYSMNTQAQSYYSWYISPTQYVTPTTAVTNWFTDATDAATCGNATVTTPHAAIYAGSNISGVCRKPRYIIEKLASSPNTSTGSGSLEVGTASSGATKGETDTFRITVQGWGSNANSAAQVQSIIKISYDGTSTNTSCP